jgi:hypothetical protein
MHWSMNSQAGSRRSRRGAITSTSIQNRRPSDPEENDLPYKSDIAGVAHLGGHHGHTAMLLAAGEYLPRTRNFNGTVRLIFHPAEEIMAGGPR